MLWLRFICYLIRNVFAFSAAKRWRHTVNRYALQKRNEEKTVVQADSGAERKISICVNRYRVKIYFHDIWTYPKNKISVCVQREMANARSRWLVSFNENWAEVQFVVALLNKLYIWLWNWFKRRCPTPIEPDFRNIVYVIGCSLPLSFFILMSLTLSLQTVYSSPYLAHSSLLAI